MNDIKTQDNDFESRVYEVSYLIMPSVVQEKVSEIVEGLKDTVASLGGTVIAEGAPEYIDLAYDMTATVANKKTTYQNGYFGWIKFEIDPSATKKLHAELQADQNLIRFLLIQTYREDTLAPVSEVLVKEAEDRSKKEREKNDTSLKTEAKQEDQKEPVSKEELDETIEKLIVE